MTASLVVGSVPAVLIGSYLSSRAPDRYIRPIITFVIFASGLKYVGVGTTALGWILCVVALGGGSYWLARVRPWENGRPAASPADGPPSAAVAAGPGPAGGQQAAPANGERAAPAQRRERRAANGHSPAPILDNDSAPNG